MPKTPMSLFLGALLALGATCAYGQDNTMKSFGSGFVVDTRGYILTNEHVVHRAKSVEVIVGKSRTLPATILATDEDHDLALLKVDPEEPLQAIAIGNSNDVRRQQSILVIGFPFGEDDVTSTSGRIVSIRTEEADRLLVVDAVVNPGNSGGPVLNDRGEAIGIIKSLLMAEVGGVQTKAGEIYAVPMSFAMPMLAAIPQFNWAAVGARTEALPLEQLDQKASTAVVQIMSDRVEPGTIEGAASDAQEAFSANALALIKSYLDRMELKYEVDTEAKFPIIGVPMKMDNAVHHLRVVIDAERELVYMYLNLYLKAPADHPRINEILTTLMDYNWRLNVGKFEWDKSDGEVRYSYTFTTENGVGFEAFEAILATLLNTGDQLWPELSKLAGDE